MSDKPVFIYAATYSDAVDAEADYDLLLELHAAKLVGTYDVALVRKDAAGKVHVEKHEKPTQHGAWASVDCRAMSPGITTTDTPRLPTASRIATSSTRGIWLAPEISSQ